jgi:hypothetical protein
VHGQDEQSGHGYMMLEGTDAVIHYIPHTPEMEAARSQGGLRTNAFVKLRRIATGNFFDVHELGNAELFLNRQSHFSDEARRLLKVGITPTGWGGWLGKYQAKLSEMAKQVIEIQTKERERQFAGGHSFLDSTKNGIEIALDLPCAGCPVQRQAQRL